MRSFDNPEYSPEYGTLMVRDFPAPGAPAAPPERADGDREYPARSQPCGTIARSGTGWLEGASSDGHHRVRLEAHRGPPADDRADWQDVVEVPYRTRTAWVGLSDVINRSGKPELHLGDPGLYTVRVSRRQEKDGEVWSLRFWPQEDSDERPRWLVRRRAPTSSSYSIWGEALGWPAEHLVRAFRFALEPPGRAAAGVTIEEIEALGRSWGEGQGWLDQPLWSDPLPEPAPPTGHPDLDARAAQRRESVRADRQKEAADAAALARQLGVPPPRTPREYLPMLLAVGEITVANSGGVPRYHLGTPAPIQQRRQLPPQRLATLERREAQRRYQAFCSDLLSVAFWAPRTPATVTAGALVDRLAARPEEVRATLSYAIEQGWLEVKGDAADPSAALELTLLPGRQEPARARPRPPAARPGSPRLLAVGAPPRAGCVDRQGRVVVWRDGRPVVLADTGPQPRWAHETAQGILVGNPSGVRLVHPDGRLDTVAAEAPGQASVGEDGGQVAFVESHFGRRSSHRVHLIDLSSGRRETLDWTGESIPFVSAVHRGWVYLHGAGAEGLRWQPGSTPVPTAQAIFQVDPLTGTALARDGDHRGLLVVRPGGALLPVAIDASARLAPGGTHLYTLRPEPPALTLFEVPPRGEPRIHWLPPGTSASPVPSSFGPVWEDEHHLLFLDDQGGPGQGPPGVRLDIRSGTGERVPLTPDAGYRPILVQPLLRP